MKSGLLLVLAALAGSASAADEAEWKPIAIGHDKTVFAVRTGRIEIVQSGYLRAWVKASPPKPAQSSAGLSLDPGQLPPRSPRSPAPSRIRRDSSTRTEDLLSRSRIEKAGTEQSIPPT